MIESMNEWVSESVNGSVDGGGGFGCNEMVKTYVRSAADAGDVGDGRQQTQRLSDIGRKDRSRRWMGLIRSWIGRGVDGCQSEIGSVVTAPGLRLQRRLELTDVVDDVLDHLQFGDFAILGHVRHQFLEFGQVHLDLHLIAVGGRLYLADDDVFTAASLSCRRFTYGWLCFYHCEIFECCVVPMAVHDELTWIEVRGFNL